MRQFGFPQPFQLTQSMNMWLQGRGPRHREMKMWWRSYISF